MNVGTITIYRARFADGQLVGGYSFHPSELVTTEVRFVDQVPVLFVYLSGARIVSMRAAPDELKGLFDAQKFLAKARREA